MPLATVKMAFGPSEVQHSEVQHSEVQHSEAQTQRDIKRHNRPAKTLTRSSSQKIRKRSHQGKGFRGCLLFTPFQVGQITLNHVVLNRHRMGDFACPVKGQVTAGRFRVRVRDGVVLKHLSELAGGANESI